MLQRLFPQRFDNRFPGHWLGLWLFVPVLIVQLGISFMSLFNAAHVMAEADGIPLGTFNAPGAAEAVNLFAHLGLLRLIIALLGLLALVRYRAMLPLLYLIFLAVQLGNRAINELFPTAHVSSGGAPPTGDYVVPALLAMMLVGFALSFFGGKRA